MIALDTETSLVSDQEPVPRLVSVGIAWGSTAEDAVLLHHSEAHDAVKDVLTSATPAEPVILANAPFDGCVLAERYPDLERLWWSCLRAGAVADVLTQERMLDLADGHGLKRPYNLGAVAQRRAGIPVDKTDPWRKRYVELTDTPIADWPEAAVHYAITDPIATRAVHVLQKAVRIEGLDPLADAARQARGHWALHLSSRWGVRVDPEAVAALDARLLAEREALRGELQRIGIARDDGSINMAIAMSMAKAAGVTRETNSGVGMAEDDFVQLELPEEHPLMKMTRYASFGRERNKMRNAFSRPVLRPWYTELLATGRVSARNPNTTQLPRVGGYRECLIPREGNVFVKADWAAMQLKCWAHLLVIMFGEDAPSGAMAKALRNGDDIHGRLAARLEIPRQDAKPMNFGFIGGMGIPRFIATVRQDTGKVLTEEQAWRYKRGWEQEWQPGAFFAWIVDQMEAGGGLAAIKQYRSDRLRSGCTYSETALQLLQGMESDIAKEVLWRLACRMYIMPGNPMYGARQVLFVHDENVIECKREAAEEVGAELESVMNTVANDWHFSVPSAVDVEVLERYRK